MTAFDRTPVADPAELGINAAALDELFARCQQDVDAGLMPSCQVALARDGRLAVLHAFGDGNPGSRYVIFSATKTLVAGAIWILIGEGALDITRTVADYVPEFATNGKEMITVEQVLLHTSGFPHAPFGPLEWDDRAQRLDRFASWRLNWEPGSRFEYHPTSAHWVLAEIIERVSGTDFRDFIRTRILEPLGLTGYGIGAPPGQQSDVNDLVLTGEPMPPEEIRALIGVDAFPLTEVTDEFLMRYNRPDYRAVGVPGGGGIANAADLALYYQALLHNRGDIWKPDVLADVTTNVRNRMPDYMGASANRTIGLVVAGDDGKSNVRGMGRTVSPRAFGHNGAGGQIAWADPETGLSFAYLTNGLDRHRVREWRRTTAIASRAAACVNR
jgi:CubicO group peptidase (beta-lactamase class C family)